MFCACLTDVFVRHSSNEIGSETHKTKDPFPLQEQSLKCLSLVSQAINK